MTTKTYSPLRPRYGLGWVLLALIAFPYLSRADFSGFHGGDRIQFQYSYAATPQNLVDFFILRRFAPGGGSTQIASGSTITGIDHPQGLAAGDYRYEIETHLRDGTVYYSTLWTASLPTFAGTAMLDENYSELPAASGTFGVAGGVTVNISSASNCAITASIEGKLNLTYVSGSVSASGSGQLDATACMIPTGSVWELKGNLSSLLSSCVMSGPLYVSGPNHVIDGNIIYGKLYLRESSASIRNNRFLSEIRFQRDLYVDAYSLTPEIRDNSFLGRWAIAFDDWSGQPFVSGATTGLPIPIGKNYYGDSMGPVMAGDPEFIPYGTLPIYSPLFLKRCGARLCNGGGAWLTVDGFKPAGERNTDKSVFPDIWCNGLTIVQNSVMHDAGYSQLVAISRLRAKRETLISVDVRAWDDNISNLRVYADLDGTTYQAQGGKTIRDITDRKLNGAVKHGGTTFNIILPPMTVTGSTLRVFMDTTGISGYGNPAGKTNLLYQTDIGSFGFMPYRERPLRIMVAPWEIWCPGYPTGVPDATHSAASLEQLIPAMLPYGLNHFEVIRESAGRYEAGYGGLLEIFSSTVLTDRLLLDLTLFLNEYNARAPEPVDRLVVIVKKGVLGTAQDMAAVGVNNKWIDSRICVVEEDSPNGPDSALHELGHSLGLYTGISGEQYGRWQYPPDGLPLKSYTAFSPEPGYDADQTRIRHMVPWITSDAWFDVMGRGNPFWISESSLQAFWGFDSGLGGPEITATKTTRSLTAAAAPAASPAPGMRRILLRGLVDTNLMFVANTIRGFDATTRLHTEVPPNTHLSNLRYVFEAFDSGGSLLTNVIFILDSAHPSQTNSLVGITPWQATFDVPDTTLRCNLHREYLTDVLWSATSTGTLSCAITAPAAPGPVSNLIALTWGTTHNGAFPPLYQIKVSTNNGVSWQDHGGLFSTNTWNVPPSFLRPGAQIGFKVVASDGMKTAEAAMSPFSLADQPPTLRITSPLNGDRGLNGTNWTLTAEVSDPEDGVITHGQWSSSLTGPLATGSGPVPVSLSTGLHTISFATWDAGGHSITASVQVAAMTNFTTVDLALHDDSISVRAPDDDPSWTLAPHLQCGVSNFLGVTIRNEGWSNTTGVLSLYLQPPAGSESLLASQSVTMAEFDTASLGAFYIPGTSGLYRLRGVISGASPTDTDASNNESIVWIPADLGSVHVTLDPPEAVAAGAQWALDGGAWINSGVAISNVQAGSHAITFKPVPDFHTPPSRTADVSAARTFLYCRRYDPYHGMLQVSLQPSRAVTEGAAWRIDGGAWHASGETVSNLQPGVRTVDFKPLPWWSNPPPISVTTVDHELTLANGTYVALPRPPDPAIVYYPTNGQENVQVSYASLQWYSSPSTTAYRVWCGTDPALGPSTYKGEFSGYEGFNWFDVTLQFDQPHYWRIDLMNSVGVTTGNVWTFHTQGQIPVLVSARQVSGEVGSLFTYQPAWTFAHTNWAEDVPAWVTTGPGGRMQGWPTSAGSSYVYLYATNQNGTTLEVCEFNVQGGPVLAWQQAASPTNTRLLAIAWGDDTYVAVGEKGVVITSSNGLNWVTRSSGRTNHLNSIAYGNGRFVAVGEADTVLVSTNRGVTWSYNAPGGYSAPWNGIGFGSNLFAAVGYYKTIYTSTNGSTWTSRNSGGIGSLAAVAASSNRWLAVGGYIEGYPSAMISTNGLSWSNVVSGVEYNGFYATCWNGALFSAVGAGGRIMTTTNGITWNNHTPFTSAALMAVAAADDRFAVAGGGGVLALSRNGANWALQSSGVSSDLRGITFGDRRVVAVGDLGTIVTAAYEPDTDRDTMPDWAERLAGTGLTNPASFLGITTVSQANGKPVIRWQAVTGHVYRIERTGQLTGVPAFTGIATNIQGIAPVTTYTDTTSGVTGPWFYRIRTP